MNEYADAARAGSRVGATWGVVVVILGLLAIAMPFITGVAVAVMVGIIMIAAGIAQFFYAFKCRSFGEGVLRFLFSLFAVLAGVSLLVQPGAGLATLTMFLAAWFFVDGIWSLVSGLRWRPFEGWGWMVFSGIVSIVLGVMIYRQFPESALWLVGVLVGVRLVFSGMAMIMMGAATEAVVDEAEKSGSA